MHTILYYITQEIRRKQVLKIELQEKKRLNPDSEYLEILKNIDLSILELKLQKEYLT